MIRKFLTCTLVFIAGIITANAEKYNLTGEKAVTNKWSFTVGSASVANHFLSNQEYNGSLIGITGEHGALYRRSANLTWDFNLSLLSSPYIKVMDIEALSNPAGTDHYALHNLFMEYGTHYNWNPIGNLILKAGGYAEFFAGYNMGRPNHINNTMSFDVQTQLKAAVGIKHCWCWEKFGLDLYGDVDFPLLGGMMVDSKYQSSIGVNKSDILHSDLKHFVFSSFHNLKGYNATLGMDLVFKTVTLSLAYETRNRWWHAYDVQNYRLYRYVKIGLGVDLVSRSRVKNDTRHF